MLPIAAAHRRRAQRRRAIAADRVQDLEARHRDTEKRRKAPALRAEVRDELLASEDESSPNAVAGSPAPRNFTAGPEEGR